jgi:hypothetical protein
MAVGLRLVMVKQCLSLSVVTSLLSMTVLLTVYDNVACTRGD